MKDYPLEKSFYFIEPGPVVLLTTAHRGRMNVMTLTWHMLVDFDPVIAVLVSNADYSFNALKKTKECVISIPGVDLIERVVDIGNCSGEDVDKFERFRLTPLAARHVGAPLVKECLVTIECRVIDTSMVNRYCMFILKGLACWKEDARRERRFFHANGDGTFVVDGRTRDLKKRMVKFPEMV